jgi:hypothetical protein
MLERLFANISLPKKKFISSLSVATSILFLASCSLFTGSNNDLEATVAALSLQGTVVAQQATIDSQNLQTTMLAQQATQLSQWIPPTSAPPAVIQTEVVVPIPDTITATEESPIPDAELEEKIKAAKILLFEDTSGNQLGLVRYVKEAIESGGYAYTDVGSAQGWLKDQLISMKEWDLIIIAAELSGMLPGYNKLSGEFFTYIKQYLDQGTAVIMELPTLDLVFQGNIRPILDQCGVEYQDNWLSQPSSSVWFLVPENPIFHQPNEIGPSLRDYQKMWPDSGDLLEIKFRSNQQIGDALFLAGTRTDKKTSYGTLTTCMGGRLVLQTFATHHYNQENIINLWQNYTYYTLKNHFLYQSP